jgi:hypothetical protein
MEWDMVDFEEVERVRPSFKGIKKCGAYVDGYFVELKPDANGEPMVLYSPHSTRIAKVRISKQKNGDRLGDSMPIQLHNLLTTIDGSRVYNYRGIPCCRCCCYTGNIVFRIFIQRIQETFGSIIAGMINSIVIMVFSTAYRKVATILTDWENHRTESEYENSMIVKNFIFQFVNSYVSLFYIAFLKGTQLYYILQCFLGRFNVFGFPTVACSPDCMTELAEQLGSLFLTAMFVQQSMEVGYPWLMQKLSIMWEERKTHEDDIPPVSFLTLV